MRNIFLIIQLIFIFQLSVICKNEGLKNQSKSKSLNYKGNTTPSFLAVKDRATLALQRSLSSNLFKPTKSVNQIKSLKEFQDAISEDKVTAIDFHAVWCGPCKVISPVFEKLAGELPSVAFMKVDVDEVPDVSAECGIRAMPTFQIFRKGEKIGELVGANPAALKELINKHAQD